MTAPPRVEKGLGPGCFAMVPPYLFLSPAQPGLQEAKDTSTFLQLWCWHSGKGWAPCLREPDLSLPGSFPPRPEPNGRLSAGKALDPFTVAFVGEALRGMEGQLLP